MQGTARFVVSTRVNSIALGLEDTEDCVCVGTTEHKAVLPDLLNQAHCLA